MQGIKEKHITFIKHTLIYCMAQLVVVGEAARLVGEACARSDGRGFTWVD